MAGPSFPHQGVIAVRFAANVFIGSAIVWTTLRLLQDTNPIWAVASLVASSDPQVRVAVMMFRNRMINVLVGCAVGLAFVSIGGENAWKLPVAMAITVLLSSYVIRIRTMWRQAPITAAIVIAADLTHHTRAAGLEFGLHKVAEVMFGCLMGMLVSWLMAKVWPLPGSIDDDEGV